MCMGLGKGLVKNLSLEMSGVRSSNPIFIGARHVC